MSEDVMNPGPAWMRRIAEAQSQTHETIAGKAYERRAYGSEVKRPKLQCRDCAVRIGQLHVVGCCVELCPVCGSQAIACSCPEADEHGVQ